MTRASAPHATLAALAPYLRLVHDFAAGPEFQLRQRCINDHALLYVRRGRGELITREGASALAPGVLILVPPDRDHAFTLGDRAGVHLLNLHLDPLPRPDSPRVRWDQDPRRPRRQSASSFTLFGARVLALPLTSPAVYEARFAALSRRWPASDPAGGLEARAAALDLLASALRELHGGTAELADEPALAKVREYLDAAVGRVGLRDLERVAAIGRTRLCAGFRRRYGLTPLAYLRTARIERSKADLVYAGLPVKAAAQRAGFASVHAFSKVFTRLVGEPPARFQRRARGR
ncbi:MAG: helix-turn-helix transcriptional regulator [Planctomycetes bacterium]|nr:helix-turn-helix transcriptional regulator [Planctomycetota bacterium]